MEAEGAFGGEFVGVGGGAGVEVGVSGGLALPSEVEVERERAGQSELGK